MAQSEHATDTTDGAPYSVLVVEDAWHWAAAMEAIIDSLPGARCVGVADGPAAAIEQVEAHRPNMALVDLRLGRESGLRVARVVHTRFPDTQVVIITAEPTEWSLKEARRAGVVGFISKDDLRTADDAAQMIQSVRSGELVFSHPAAPEGTPGIEWDQAATAARARFGITPRQLEQLVHLRDGRSYEEIAELMNVGMQTAKTLTSKMCARFGISGGRIPLVAKAIELRLLAPQRPASK